MSREGIRIPEVVLRTSTLTGDDRIATRRAGLVAATSLLMTSRVMGAKGRRSPNHHDRTIKNAWEWGPPDEIVTVTIDRDPKARTISVHSEGRYVMRVERVTASPLPDVDDEEATRRAGADLCLSVLMIMDMRTDDPRLAAAEGAMNVVRGWAESVRAAHEGAVGEADCGTQARLATPWSKAAWSVFWHHETHPATPMPPEPGIEAVHLNHTPSATFLKPLQIFVHGREDPITTLRAIEAYRSHLA